MEQTRETMRQKRKLRIRAKVHGTAKRPRLAVFRSHTALTAQLIDDEAGKTLCGVRVAGNNMSAAKQLGAEILTRTGKMKITRIVFDRSGYRYHGVIAAIADSVREGGVTV